LPGLGAGRQTLMSAN